MIALIKAVQRRAQQRAAYDTTLRELDAMSLSTAIDLGMFHEDFRDLARRAVYGR